MRPNKPKQGKGYQCKHPDCMYRGRGNPKKTDLPGCDYNAMTGQTRTKRDKPADSANCDYYKPRAEIPRRRGPTPSMPLWDSLARGLYMAGHSDAEIAEACSLNAKTIAAWRRRLGFAANTKPRESRLDWEKARELYELKKSDCEIAEAIGCTHGCVYLWRKKNNLPPPFGIFGKRVEP